MPDKISVPYFASKEVKNLARFFNAQVGQEFTQTKLSKIKEVKGSTVTLLAPNKPIPELRLSCDDTNNGKWIFELASYAPALHHELSPLDYNKSTLEDGTIVFEHKNEQTHRFDPKVKDRTISLDMRYTISASINPDNNMMTVKLSAKAISASMS